MKITREISAPKQLLRALIIIACCSLVLSQLSAMNSHLLNLVQIVGIDPFLK